MKWINETPIVPGKYIIQTKSLVLNTIKTLDAKLSFNSKGNAVWSFNNQNFYRYLKET